MAVRSKIDTFERDIELLISSELSPEARSRHLADFAKQELAVAQERNRAALGRVPPHETTVDQRKGAPVESVKPDGTIVYEFQLFDEVLGAIAEMLIRASPVRTGRYQSSHALFADGVEVVPGQIPPEAEEFAFVNSQPYARKIEKGLSPQAPEGVFHVVSVLAARRFSNIARIKFSFRPLPAGAIGGWAQTGSARALAQRIRGGNPRTHDMWLVRQPAIVISRY